MAGFEGYISIFEDDSFGGTVQSSPQALYVDKEELAFDKAIDYRPYSVGSSRVGLSSHLVNKEKKPKGALSYQFRSGDILKVLFAHFQNGTQNGTQYQFYPRTNPMDYSLVGTWPNQGYGAVTAKPYTVSLLKKMFNTSLAGGTNSFFFKSGIVDKLNFSLQAGQDARVSANFMFRDVDIGTAVPASVDNTVAAYETTPPFVSWAATAVMNGTAFELSSFNISSDNSIQEFSRVGRQDPEHYQYSGYTCKGNLTFDLPYDAMSHVGSMFGTQPFSITATLFNGTADSVAFEMPNCVRLPFEYQFSDGASPVRASIPFQAFESAGTYPIRVTACSNALFLFNGTMDALLGARGALSEFDASLGARSLGGHIILDRT